MSRGYTPRQAQTAGDLSFAVQFNDETIFLNTSRYVILVNHIARGGSRGGSGGSCPRFYKVKCPNITCYKLQKNHFLTIENFTQIWLRGQRNFHRPPPPPPPLTHTFFKFWIRPLHYLSSTLVIKGGSRIWKMCV